MSWVECPSGKITQGSIVDGVDWGFGDDNPLSIVLSNACDIDNHKCSYLILLALNPAGDMISMSKEFKNYTSSANARWELSNKPWQSLCNFLNGYIHNKNICRYYFIDPSNVIDAPLFVADFQLIKSIDINEIDKLDHVALLPSPFLQQLIVHFSSYTARIPSDRVNDDKEKRFIEELACGYKKAQ